MQQAGCDAGGERPTRADQEGQSRPERIADGDVGFANPGVKEQVGHAVAGEVLGQRHTGGEDRASRIDPAGGRLGAEIPCGAGIVRDRPEDTAGHALEDAHPGVAGGGQNLEVVVEAAEVEALLGQATFGPGQDPVGIGTVAVVDLMALGEPEDLFAVVGEVGGGNDAGVDNDVVDEGGSLSAGVLKPVDLNGGAAFGEDRSAVVLVVAVRIDGNFDTELSAEAGDFEVRLSPQIEDAVERGG